LISKYTKENDQEKRDKHINRIKDSVKHLNDILEDFLSLGKLDEGRISTEPYEFNLKEMITETLNEVKVVLKPGQKIDFNYEGDENVNSDKKLVRNILINLISNAAKFFRRDSPLQIS
jgi:signal transduction histidine kinase